MATCFHARSNVVTAAHAPREGTVRPYNGKGKLHKYVHISTIYIPNKANPNPTLLKIFIHQ